MTEAEGSLLISVISITLDDREGLINTVESLKSQVNPPSYEHIIVDGVSNYDVPQLLAELGSQARLYQGPDCGIYDAMNCGTDMARGEYLLYLNSGDQLCDSGVMATLAETLLHRRPDFLWCDSLERQLDGKVCYKSSREIKYLPFGMITHHQAMLFRRSVVEKKAIRYDLAYTIAADYDFVLRHVRNSRVKCYLPEPVCVFARGGMSYQRRHMGRIEQYRIRRDTYGSALFSGLVFIAQLALRSFRSILPSGYWALRKRLG